MEEINNSVSPVIEIPNKQNNIFRILFIISILIIIGLVIVIFFLLQNSKQSIVTKTKPEIEETITPTINKTTSSIEENTIIPEKEADEISDFKTYKNEIIGFSFKYPSSFGEITGQIVTGLSGSMFLGKFNGIDDSKSFYPSNFGGISKDYDHSRGSILIDFNGYINNDGAITFKTTNNNQIIIEPSKIKKIYKNKNNVEIVLLESYDESAPGALTFGKNQIGVLVNTNDKTYPGIAFTVPKTFESDLLKLLETFSLTK